MLQQGAKRIIQLKYLYLFLLLLLFIPSQAQSYLQADSLVVYFDTDKSEVKESYVQAIGILLEKYNRDEIVSITLSGHTDSRASESYNLDLSKRRVDAVWTVLSDFGLSDVSVLLDFMGEKYPVDNNETEVGMQKNRRVEIVFAIEIKEEEIVAVDAIPIDTCTYETTIIQNGVRFTMNICDYEREKACLSFSTYLSPDEILEAGLTTMTSTGSPLISGGMVEINKCTDACITVRMPVRRNLCENGLGMTIWSISENGGWIETDMETEVEKDGDSTFYVIEVCKSGILNCDKPSKPPLYTISTRNRLKIISATLSFEGPLYSYTESEDKPDRKVKIPAPCPCTSPLLSMTAIDKHGDTVSMVLEPINQFKKRTWFKGCKEEQIGSFLFFKFYQKRLYRKYIIRRSDFDKQGVRGL